MKKRRSRILTLLIWIMLLAGESLLLYPVISNLLIDHAAQEEIRTYSAAVTRTIEEDRTRLDTLLRQAQEYNAMLSGDTTSLSPASTQEGRNGLEEEPETEADMQAGPVSFANYDEMLAVTESIGSIEVPKIGVYLPIYHGLDEKVLQKGIGHMPESSLPIGGRSTHAVLSGHTGLPAAKLFTDLDQLKKGDRFYIHVLDQILAYEVDQILVVLPDETEAIRIVEGKDYVTLLTCTPYGINSHRLLVRGTRIPYEPVAAGLAMTAEPETKQQFTWFKIGWYALAGLGLLLILIMLAGAIRGRKNQHT